MKNKFTTTEKRIIKALFRLDRFANANEISKVADNMAWATAKKALAKLYLKKRILEKKVIKKILYYKIKEGIL